MRFVCLSIDYSPNRRHRDVMKAIPIIIALGFFFLNTAAHARCGYYAGYGYRCFGDKGGTGGKAFKEMDKNSKACGYFDPGCQRNKQKPAPKKQK